MARINIEDQFFIEVADLVAALGDKDRAYGMALRWFRFAQERHKSGRLVSEEDYTTQGFHPALFPILAIRTDAGIKCAGSDKHFGWLDQNKEAGSIGGKKSAKRPRDAKGRLTKVQATSKRSQPSSSYSPSSSDSGSFNLPSEDTAPAASKANAFIADYCRRFKERWGTYPEIKGKNAGIAKRLAEGWSVEKGKFYLEAFFQMPDAQLVKWKHPLSALEMKLNEVTVFADSGQFTTNRQAQQSDDAVAVGDQIKRIREGKL